MKLKLGLLCAGLSLQALGADAGTPKDASAKPAEAAVTATAELKNAKGKSVGTATLRQTPNGVVVDLKVKGMPAGEHAFHVHEVGKCEAPFKTAGGHFNPVGHQHGIENAQGKHAGDLPNLHIPKSGELQVTLFTEAVTLQDGKTSVFDADGSSLVVHAGKDDYKSDPAGNAGDRIACGVITKK